jgi:hypothetical protein
MSMRKPDVKALAVHEEGGQTVQFTEENAKAVAEEPPATQLTAWLALNALWAAARDGTEPPPMYSDIPAML